MLPDIARLVFLLLVQYNPGDLSLRGAKSEELFTIPDQSDTVFLKNVLIFIFIYCSCLASNGKIQNRFGFGLHSPLSPAAVPQQYED